MNIKHSVWVLPALLWTVAAWATGPGESPSGVTCGLEGNVDERILNCQSFGAPYAPMKLVMADAEGHVILEDRHGVLWGPTLEGRFDQEGAKEACKDSARVNEDTGYPTIEGVGEWRLPSAPQWARIGQEDQSGFNRWRSRVDAVLNTHLFDWVFKDIHGDQSWKKLPDHDRWFRSSSQFSRFYAWVFNGSSGFVYSGYRYSGYYYYSVRCVARR